MKKQTFKSAALYRDIGLDMVANDDPVQHVIDIESRTVTFPFSSTQPVVREYFDPDTMEIVRANEVLDHNSDISFDRLKQAGSLLVNHDRHDVVGVIEDAYMDAERGLATVRFGRSERAQEIFNDVVDGIRRTVSFGYRVLEAVRQDAEENELPTMLIKRWDAFEVSLETIPADYKQVGIGRNTEEDHENDFVVRSEEEIKEEIPIVQITKENKMSDNQELKNGIKAERKRINGIRKIADNVRHLIPEIDEIKEEFMNSERTVDEFNAAIVAKMDSVRMDKIENAPTQDLELTGEEVKSYSLMRLGNALTSGDWKHAGYELEVSRAQADLNGTEARGAFIPLSILSTRADADQTGVVAPTTYGAGLVPTDFWGSEYIDVLRANSVVAAMGARILPGLVGDVDIPKALSEGTFAYLTEGGNNYATTSYSATTVELKPQDIGAALGYTRKMAKQTGNPAIEQILRDSLNTGMGVFLDKQVLVGTQAGASGLTTSASSIYSGGVTTVYSSATHANNLILEAAVATANAEQGTLGYVCSPATRGYMKGRVKDSSGAGGFVWDASNMVNGYKAMVTTHAADNIFYGNWNDVLIGMWGGVDIVVDTATKVHTGGVVLRAFLACDIAYRHAQSFAVQTNIDN